MNRPNPSGESRIHTSDLMTGDRLPTNAEMAWFLSALGRLYDHAMSGTGQGLVIAQLLAALYNGHDYRFDLVQLRGLDDDHWRDCLGVIALDRWGGREVHRHVVHGDTRIQAIIRFNGLLSQDEASDAATKSSRPGP